MSENPVISATDEEGKRYFGKIRGLLNTKFLDGANHQSNKPYLKAVHQILEQVDSNKIDLEVDKL